MHTGTYIHKQSHLYPLTLAEFYRAYSQHYTVYELVPVCNKQKNMQQANKKETNKHTSINLSGNGIFPINSPLIERASITSIMKCLVSYKCGEDK